MAQGDADAVLIQRARLGSKEAFGELVLRYHRSVMAIAYRMTGDAALADDAAQAAFLRAWTHLDDLRDPSAFRGWLYRLAVSASSDQRRQAARSGGPLPEELADGADPEGDALALERARAVRQAALALPEQCRAALILREYQGLSYREIARSLGVPIGTVMSRLNYARALLRAALTGELEAAGAEAQGAGRRG